MPKLSKKSPGTPRLRPQPFTFVSMLRVQILAVLLLGGYWLNAQTVQEIQTAARDQQRTGGYANALTILTDGLQKYPANLDLEKDLALNYYLMRDYKKGVATLQRSLKDGSADEQVYQVTAMLYRGLLDYKEGETLLKSGIKAFPNSGTLYSEYGDMLDSKTPGQGLGLQQFEAGIKADPSFPGNYYKAAKALQTSNFWIGAMLYAEIYCNLDSYSARTTEMKNLMFDCLRKSLMPGNSALLQTNGKFEEAVHSTLMRHATVAKAPLTPEALSALRTRFVLDWQENSASKWPFQLFAMQRSLVTEGHFDAYNQWLLGPPANLTAFDNWTKTHDREYKAFTNYKQNRIFTMPAGQYYK